MLAEQINNQLISNIKHRFTMSLLCDIHKIFSSFLGLVSVQSSGDYSRRYLRTKKCWGPNQGPLHSKHALILVSYLWLKWNLNKKKLCPSQAKFQKNRATLAMFCPTSVLGSLYLSQIELFRLPIIRAYLRKEKDKKKIKLRTSHF